MIQANELRIGNYFLSPSTQKAKQCTCEDISDIQSGYKRILPISLTHEILEKLGFDISEQSNCFKYPIILSHITTDEYFEFEFKHPYLKSSIISVKYLHQLQNLYYALTGEELLSHQL